VHGGNERQEEHMSSLPRSASFGVRVRTLPSFDDEIAPSETPELTFVEAVKLRAAQKRNQGPIQKKRRSKRFLRRIAYFVVAIVLVAGVAAFFDELKFWFSAF
jgi:hypothetical protein